MTPGGSGDIRSERLAWMAQTSGLEFGAVSGNFDDKVQSCHPYSCIWILLQFIPRDTHPILIDASYALSYDGCMINYGNIDVFFIELENVVF